SSSVNERKHRCSSWPPGLQRAVVLVVLEIAPAHEHHDVSRLVIEPDHRALKIFRRGLIGSGSGRAVCLCFAKTGCVLGVSLMRIIGMLFNPFEIRADRIL